MVTKSPIIKDREPRSFTENFGLYFNSLPALLKALSKNLHGAALDVFCNEPWLDQALKKHPRIFVLPHIGSATEKARSAMAQLAVSGVIEVLSGRSPRNRVN